MRFKKVLQICILISLSQLTYKVYLSTICPVLTLIIKPPKKFGKMGPTKLRRKIKIAFEGETGIASVGLGKKYWPCN